MRKEILFLFVVCFLLGFCVANVSAQEEEPKSQLFFIHYDQVIPGMVDKYEEAAKGIVAKLSENNMTELKYTVAMTNDLNYLYVYELENMADLDKNPWQDLEKKIGKEAMDAMWQPYDNTYTMHKNYLIRLWPDLSYTPETSNEQMAEMNFRHWDFYYVDPDKGDEAREIAKQWLELYKSKNITTGYRLYTGDIGTEVPVYVAVQWAKSPAEFYAQNAKNEELLGEEGQALLDKTMAITHKFEQKDGWIRPDLSYMPETGEMTEK